MKKREPISEKALNDYAEQVESQGKTIFFLEGSSPPLIISDNQGETKPKFETVYAFNKPFSKRGNLRWQAEQKLKEDFAKGVSIVTIIAVHPTKGTDRIRSYNQQGLTKN